MPKNHSIIEIAGELRHEAEKAYDGNRYWQAAALKCQRAPGGSGIGSINVNRGSIAL